MDSTLESALVLFRQVFFSISLQSNDTPFLSVMSPSAATDALAGCATTGEDPQIG